MLARRRRCQILLTDALTKYKRFKSASARDLSPMESPTCRQSSGWSSRTVRVRSVPGLQHNRRDPCHREKVAHGRVVNAVGGGIEGQGVPRHKRRRRNRRPESSVPRAARAHSCNCAIAQMLMTSAAFCRWTRVDLVRPCWLGRPSWSCTCSPGPQAAWTGRTS